MLKKDESVGQEGSKRWTVIKKIGEGGFAEVYEVFDTSRNIKVSGTCSALFKSPSGAQPK